MNATKYLAFSALVLSAALAGQPALAFTHCTVTPEKVWAGNDGEVWIMYDNGGSSRILASDPDREGILSLAITAITTGLKFRVRYDADGVDCTDTGRTDVVGAYLMSKDAT